MIEMEVLNVTDLVLLVSGVINLILGFFVLIRDSKKSANISYFLISIGVFVWISNLVLFNSFIFNNTLTLWFAMIAYVGGLSIPMAALYFVTHFGKEVSGNKHMLYAFALLFIVLAAITLVPGLVIDSVSRVSDISSMTYGPLYIPYASYLAGVFAIGFFYLWKRHNRASGRIKSQVRYFFIGSIIPAAISVVTNLILPYFGDFRFFMVGPSVMIIMTTLIGYTVIRHGLWDFRRILAEIFVSVLIVLSLFNFVIGESYFSATAIILFKIIAIAFTTLTAVMLLNSFKKEQKQRKKLKKLNKLLKEMDEKKNEFLHIATHQLRGPITSIQGYASLIKSGDYGQISDKILEPLKKILSASKAMSDTIEDYMSIARIEENNLTQTLTNFNLCQLVKERVDEQRNVAKDKGLKIETQLKSSGTCSVHADKHNLTQVVNALLENAIKYTKEGVITVSSKLIDKEGIGKFVQIRVVDTGIGIPKGEISQIFEKFSRASNAKEADVSGTGMGLFIIKSLMEANGGSVSIASKGEGKGTTFTIELPLAHQN